MLNIFAPPSGLLGDQEEQIRQQMQTQGLLGLAAGLFQAGAPSRTRQSLGGSALQGLMAGQQMAQNTFNQSLQAQMYKEKLDELKRQRTEDAAIRQFLPQIYKAPTPTTQEMITSEQGDDVLTRPGTPGGINYDALRQLMLVSPKRGSEIATALKTMQPKTSVQSIYDSQGREIKVRYNEDTGEYTPIGGAKAEPFVQVDRGNVIELRRPSGEVIGTLPKGAAPSATPYEITDYGRFNKATGKLEPIIDPQGNPIIIDSASKASEDEKKSAGFYLRMRDATSTFNKPLTDASGKPLLKDGKPVLLKDFGEKPEIFASVVGGIIPDWAGGQAAQNFFTSSIRQQYQQAQENWVTANLRPESGAVIGPEEMKKEIRKYFPQIGDSEATIRQKEESRKVTEDAVRRRAGRALSVMPQQQRNLNVDY